MPEKTDRERVRQLLADERAQLAGVLGRDAYEQAHPPEAAHLAAEPRRARRTSSTRIGRSSSVPTIFSKA